jgi:hypothetical protein
MRCYNAAMRNRFRFSMRRLFVAVSLCCLAAWIFGNADLSPGTRIWVGSITSLAAIGSLFEQPVEAAASAGFISAILLFVGYLLYAMAVLATHRPKSAPRLAEPNLVIAT